MKILNGGEHSYIGVGLSGKNSNLNGLPGWKRSSYGYHGDDGRIFEYSSIGRGRKYGEKFGSNDIIGTYSNQYVVSYFRMIHSSAYFNCYINDVF